MAAKVETKLSQAEELLKKLAEALPHKGYIKYPSQTPPPGTEVFGIASTTKRIGMDVYNTDEVSAAKHIAKAAYALTHRGVEREILSQRAGYEPTMVEGQNLLSPFKADDDFQDIDRLALRIAYYAFAGVLYLQDGHEAFLSEEEFAATVKEAANV